MVLIIQEILRLGRRRRKRFLCRKLTQSAIATRLRPTSGETISNETTIPSTKIRNKCKNNSLSLPVVVAKGEPSHTSKTKEASPKTIMSNNLINTINHLIKTNLTMDRLLATLENINDGIRRISRVFARKDGTHVVFVQFSITEMIHRGNSCKAKTLSESKCTRTSGELCLANSNVSRHL